MKKLAFLLSLLAIPAVAQYNPPAVTATALYQYASAPAACTVGQVYVLISTFQPYYCSAANTWSAFGSGGGGSFTALTGDATSTSTGGATTVKGLNGTLLSGLATGVLGNTTSTGVPFIYNASTPIPAAYGGTGTTFGAMTPFGNGLVEYCAITVDGTLTCSQGPTIDGCAFSSHTGEGVSATKPVVSKWGSNAASGACSGWYGDIAVYYDGRQPKVVYGTAFNATGDYSNARIQIGLVGNACTQATVIASDTPACSYAVMRYSTSASDTFFSLVTDNGSGTPTVTPTTITPASIGAQTLFYVTINIGASSISGCINSTCVTSTTTLPASSSLMFDLHTNTNTSSTGNALMTSGVYGISQNGNY